MADDDRWYYANDVTATTVTATDGVIAETDYVWQIRTNCSDAPDGDWAEGTFTTADNPTPGVCGVPGNLSNTLITETQGRANWGTGSGAENYEFRFKKASDSEWITRTGLRDTFRQTLTGLDSGTDYVWQVRSNCGDGVKSEWTDLQSFTTLGGNPDPDPDPDPDPTTGLSIFTDAGQNGFDVRFWGATTYNVNYTADKQEGNSAIQCSLGDCDFLVIEKAGTPQSLADYSAISFYAKASNNVQANVSLRGNVSTNSQSINLGTTWQEYTIQLNGYTPNISDLSKLLLQVESNANGLLIDNIQLVE